MKCPDGLNIFPVCVPVGTQVPHAVGAAMGVKYRGDKKAVACYFGDGGTSEGDFHEGMNFAGAFKLPVVFICQNNHWAISVPREKQTASKTLAQKGLLPMALKGFRLMEMTSSLFTELHQKLSERQRMAMGQHS